MLLLPSSAHHVVPLQRIGVRRCSLHRLCRPMLTCSLRSARGEVKAVLSCALSAVDGLHYVRLAILESLTRVEPYFPSLVCPPLTCNQDNNGALYTIPPRVSDSVHSSSCECLAAPGIRKTALPSSPSMAPIPIPLPPFARRSHLCPMALLLPPRCSRGKGVTDITRSSGSENLPKHSHLWVPVDTSLRCCGTSFAATFLLHFVMQRLDLHVR